MSQLFPYRKGPVLTHLENNFKCFESDIDYLLETTLEENEKV